MINLVKIFENLKVLDIIEDAERENQINNESISFC